MGENIPKKLLQRGFISKAVPQTNAFNVMQFNILADGLSGAKKTQSDHKSFTMCPNEALVWDYRRELIFQEIKDADPDIVCTQENDHYEDFVTALSDQWEGEFQAKSGSACEHISGIPDGCSIHWKRNRFQLKGEPLRHKFSMGSQVFLCVNLLDLLTQKDVIVCTTHLRAAKNEDGERTRHDEVVEMHQVLSERFGSDPPLILTADLNASPTKGDKEYESTAYPALLSGKIPLKSSYKELLGDEPRYTTAKVREGLMAHTIDYITYNASFFSPSGYLELPELDSLAPVYVPSLQYPSDHFSLCVEFNYIEGASFTEPPKAADDSSNQSCTIL